MYTAFLALDVGRYSIVTVNLVSVEIQRGISSIKYKQFALTRYFCWYYYLLLLLFFYRCLFGSPIEFTSAGVTLIHDTSLMHLSWHKSFFLLSFESNEYIADIFSGHVRSIYWSDASMIDDENYVLCVGTGVNVDLYS